MRLLFVGVNDWANIAHNLARSLNLIEPDLARVVVINRHPFGYVEGDLEPDSKWLQRQDLLLLVNAGDGNYPLMDYTLSGLGVTPDAFIALHTGSAYRRDPHRYEIEDAERGAILRVVGCSLLRFALGGPYESITYPFLPAHGRAAAHPCDRSDELRVCHTPSSRLTKGTNLILEQVTDITVIENVSHRECLEHRAQHNVFVGQMNEAVGGFGVSALEAMAQGCVVLCDIRHVRPEVWNFITPPPIIDVRTSDDLSRELEELKDPRYRRNLQGRSRSWSQQNTTGEAEAKHWLNLVTKSLDGL